MKDPTNKDLLSILEEHEEAIASLYAAFSVCLPEMKALWDQLVHEEKAHVEVLRMLRERLESGGVLLNTRKFNMAAVQTSLDYIKRHIAKIPSEGITALRALSLALNFEHAIIEKEFFCIFESDSTEMKSEFQALRDHTASHQKLLEGYLESEKRRMDS
jgi:hypothetical protein